MSTIILILIFSSLVTGVTPPSHRSSSPNGLAVAPTIPRKADAKVLGGFASQSVNVYGGYSAEPAPMGVTDFGVGPNGPYEYSTNSSVGSAKILSLSTKNSTGSPWMSFQLNVNLQFHDGNKVYVYWVQDVAFLNTATNGVLFEDNVWNSSAVGGTMSSAGISGNGQVVQFGNEAFYGVAAGLSLPGNYVALAYPTTMTLRVNSSVSAARQPTVTFEYNDGYGWQVFDAVVFASVHQLTTMSGFVVDGFAYNPGGLFYDSEFILGGPGGGGQTTDTQSDVRMQLQYWNGHNYQLVTNAYNFGGDTAEGIQNALSQHEYDQGNGGVTAEVQTGPGTLGKLWDQSGVGIVDLKTSLPSGTLDVRNSSNLAATPGQYAFTNGEVTVTLQPGSYELQVYSGVNLSTAGKYPLTAGQLLQLRTPLGIIPLTLSYSIVGGGSGYSPPTLTFTYSGVIQTMSLSTTPAVFDLDSGSAWSVSSQLPGSSGTQRWQAVRSTNGTAALAQSESVAYYHQFLETISQSVVGGGSGFSAPSLTGQQFGSSASLPLGASSGAFWLDSGTAFSATNPLSGSTSTERWFAADGGGTVTGPVSVTITFAHQFYLTVTGGALRSQWYDSGAEAQVSEPDTYGRSSGTGQRLVYYAVDSGQQDPIVPSLGNVSVTAVMDAPHAISFSSVSQYQVSLDATAAQALSSITAPTIAGDGYWYDSGSKVNVTLDGVWGRSAGAGERLAAYSLDGGAQVQVDAATPVAVLAIPAISSPQLVSGKSTAQFFLDAGLGSLASITPTPISGDAGWYDNQTTAKAVYNYAWSGSAGQSRMNAVSYSVDGGQPSLLPRQGSGTFTVSTTMDRPHKIEVKPLAQYSFTFSGGFNVTLSSQSPTGDGFYDVNSSVTATSSYIGNTTPDQERQALTGYSLDSGTVSIPRNDTGTFTTPTITFDSYHSLVFQSVKQYFVAFAFRDASGASKVTPTALKIDESGSGPQGVPGLNLWLDSGTNFTISSVLWEGLDVKLLNPASYQASAPANITVDSRIYPASVKVTDLFGFAVQGAEVAAKLANGTTVTRATNSSGVTSLGLIPIGTYQVSISNLGASASMSADASVRGEATSTVALSVPVLGATFIVVAALALGALLVRGRRRSKTPP